MILEAVEQTEEVVEKSKEFWELVKDYLTPQTLTAITSLILLCVAVLKLVSVVSNLKKQNAMTMDNLLERLKGVVQDVGNNQVQKAILELINPLELKIDALQPVLEVFSKILALSQENSPESRLAILDLIEQLGNLKDVKLIETTKETIVTKEEEKAEVKKELEEIANLPVE